MELGKFLLIPPDLSVARMVLYDQEGVNLSTFGSPEVDFITTEPDTSKILDVCVPPEFSMNTSPLIFMRFSNSVKVLNIATRKLTEIIKVPLGYECYSHPVE